MKRPEKKQKLSATRYFDKATKASGLGMRRLQNAARQADQAIGDIAEAATMAAKMGYNPKKLVLAMTG